MATIDELRKVRLEKLKSLQSSGLLAYPATTKRTHSIAEGLTDFEEISKSGKEVVLTGRIMAMRGHGGAMFLDIYDGSELSGVGDRTLLKIQGLIKEDKVGPKGYKFFGLVRGVPE